MKKVWSVFFVGCFAIYLIKYETAAPLYERVLVSALGALLTPAVLFALLWIPAFALLFMWVLLRGLVVSFISWLKR